MGLYHIRKTITGGDYMEQTCNCFELEPIFETKENKEEYVTILKCCSCGREYATNRRTKEEYLQTFFIED